MSNTGISTNTIRKKDDYSNLECSIRDDADKERQTPGPQGGSHKTMKLCVTADRRTEHGEGDGIQLRCFSIACPRNYKSLLNKT